VAENAQGRKRKLWARERWLRAIDGDWFGRGAGAASGGKSSLYLDMFEAM
jgi:hypothetical protein